jgi:flavin-dependent dehydrogenase
MRRNYDAIVIGGGPAGSTAAAVLAQHGRRVVVLEKEKFPRYHIGESMMPLCYFPLQRTGALERIQSAGFPRKYSVQFVSANGQVSQPFYFFQHLDHEAATTWQVPRAQFDQILLDHARDCGAAVHEQTRARELVRNETGAVCGVRAEASGGERLEFEAPMTIDASGRDALTVARNSWRVFDEKLKKVALWTYYRGARRDPGLDEAATTVAYIPHKGWFWYIPLPDDVVSVGVVCEKDYLYRETRDPASIFAREVRENDWVREHLEPGVQFGDYYATGEFSYRGLHCAMDGVLLAGDAFAFLDPVFSSGLFLALKSGEMAADAVHAALDSGDFTAGQFEPYSKEICKGIEAMRNLVYAFYDEGFNFGRLMRAHPHLRGDLTDCLIGDLFRDFSDLFRAVGEFATLPPELSHGAPLITPAA